MSSEKSSANFRHRALAKVPRSCSFAACFARKERNVPHPDPLAAVRDSMSPRENPPRARGEPVWRDMDQRQLDDAYDQSIYAPNAGQIAERREAANKQALARLGPPWRAAYGPSDIETVDIYQTSAANAPILVFIHGGAWRNGRAAQCAYMAEPFVRAGAHFVAIDFINVNDASGDLFAVVDQVRRAVAWVYRNASSFGGDADRLYAAGHSSGAHLCGCVMITEWENEGLPETIVKGALLSSGMYDLHPVRLSKRSEYVAFTDAMVEELSPIRHIERVRTPLILSHGTYESPEFQRQTREFNAALEKARKPVELRIGVGYNHFEIQETLANPCGALGRAALSLLTLD